MYKLSILCCSSLLYYKSIHKTSKRGVVIKKIRGAAANSINEKTFAKEMSKIRFLAHPGIPKVEAFYRLDADICLVFLESNGCSVRCVMDVNGRGKFHRLYHLCYHSML